jgi:hypothetical protein
MTSIYKNCYLVKNVLYSSYLIPGHEPGQVDHVRASRDMVARQHCILRI